MSDWQHDDQDDELAALVRRMFPPRQVLDLGQDVDEQPADRGNHVPREGTTTSRTKPADYDERVMVGQLFGTNPNAVALDDPNDYPHKTEYL